MGKSLKAEALLKLVLDSECVEPTYALLSRCPFNREEHERVGVAPVCIGQFLGLKERLRKQNEQEKSKKNRELNLIKQTILHNLAKLELDSYIAGFENEGTFFLCTNGFVARVRVQQAVAA